MVVQRGESAADGVFVRGGGAGGGVSGGFDGVFGLFNSVVDEGVGEGHFVASIAAGTEPFV